MLTKHFVYAPWITANLHIRLWIIGWPCLALQYYLRLNGIYPQISSASHAYVSLRHTDAQDYPQGIEGRLCRFCVKPPSHSRTAVPGVANAEVPFHPNVKVESRGPSISYVKNHTLRVTWSSNSFSVWLTASPVPYPSPFIFADLNWPCYFVQNSLFMERKTLW